MTLQHTHAHVTHIYVHTHPHTHIAHTPRETVVGVRDLDVQAMFDAYVQTFGFPLHFFVFIISDDTHTHIHAHARTHTHRTDRSRVGTV